MCIRDSLFHRRGSGGQGLITAGIILAEAAGVHEGRKVIQTQSYGPEARGGSSRSDVIISDTPIHHTEVEHPDVLVCLSQPACTRYSKDLKPGGTLIIDPLYVKEIPVSGVKVIPVEATRIATELGKVVVANVVTLGAVIAATGCVSRTALEAAVLGRAPRGTEELNRKALAAGFEAAALAGVTA